jgi:citrate synthase
MLLNELKFVHQKIAERMNASTVAIITGAQLGKDYFTSVASALLTLGNVHAPLQQTNNLLSMSYPFNYMYDCLKKGYKIPGWGSSFSKGEEDPVFGVLKNQLLIHQPRMMEVVEEITDRLQHSTGSKLYPNAACYTILCFMDHEDIVEKNSRALLATDFLISSRMPVWSELYFKHYHKGCKG